MSEAPGLPAVTTPGGPARRRKRRKYPPFSRLAGALWHTLRTSFVRRPRPVHLFVAVADHWEPSRGKPPAEVAEARVRRWLDRYPGMADEHRDWDGRPPRHTWFYPWDEWRDGEVAAISELVYHGYGEVELHLHHDGDTSDSLRASLAAALEAFGRHGALITAEAEPRRRYGFIHGDWCLDNSDPDGRYCGVNDELTVLRETGCYADFTYPAPKPSQPPMLNRIYRAIDDPARPRSADRGAPLTAGRPTEGDLVILPGPLGINLRDWHHRWYPAIEQGELTRHQRVTPARVRFWVSTGVGVRGRPDWVFTKLHSHGCVEDDESIMLGELRHELHAMLEDEWNDGERYRLHYCTCRELYNLAVAAEQGYRGEPAGALDHEVKPPVNSLLRADGPVEVRALSPETGDISNLADGPVDWSLKVGPVARVVGPARRLSWRGESVTLDGAAELTRREESAT